MAKLPITQVEHPGLDSGEIFIANVDGESREFWPQWQDEGRARGYSPRTSACSPGYLTR